MDSSEANESVNRSSEALIDWSTPEIVINTTYGGDYYNNPFDVMEFKAANMDPFDLISNQIPLRDDNNMSHSNIFTSSWKLEIGQLRKSMSLIDVNSVGENLKLNGQNSEGSVESINVNGGDINNQSNKNYTLINMDDNKEPKNESVSTWTSEYYKVYIEKMALCDEEEKQQIRKQTQQRIKMLIEKEEKNYVDNCTQSLIHMQRQHTKTKSNLNSTESLFNKGFIQSGSNNNSNSFSKTPDSTVDIDNNNKLMNFSFNYSNQKQNYFDLNALKPEWVVDNFNDTDGSIEIQTESLEPVVESINNIIQIDEELKVHNPIGKLESKLNGCETLLKLTQNKTTQSKGPILSDVPVYHMMQNYNDIKVKNLKPVATSTPTLSTDDKCISPSSMECSIKTCLLQQSVINSVESPKTPLNVANCIKQNSTNLYNECNIIAQSNITHLFSSRNKRSNTTINIINETVQKKTEIMKSFKLNKSKSESIIGKVPKPLALRTNKISSLPVPKRSTILFKGKENVKLQ